MVRQETLTVKHELRGGKGDVYLYHIMGADEMMGHAMMYARVVLPPGSSIGVHEHVGNTEPYYIIRGSGIFTDADGSQVRVKAGDVCLIACGESHGMENDSDEEEMEMIALILNEA